MLLTIEQVADRLQLHRDTVRRQIKRGALRGVKRGRVWRVPESALTEDIAPLTSATTEADAIWQQMTSGQAGDHNAAIIKMANAPAPVRAIIARRSAEAEAEIIQSDRDYPIWSPDAAFSAGAAMLDVLAEEQRP